MTQHQQDRIEREADKSVTKIKDTYRERENQFTNRISFLAGHKDGYIVGATAENIRTQPIIDALEKAIAKMKECELVYNVSCGSVIELCEEEIYQWLDESETAAAVSEKNILTQSRADFIREVNDRDMEGMEVIEFAEWAPTIAFFDDEYRLWELLKEGEFINGQFRFTTKELYKLFKQQKDNP